MRVAIIAGLGVVLLLGACSPARRPAPPAISAKEVAGLDAPEVAASLPLRLTVPGEGAVLPWSFPSPELRWTDDWYANTFRVRAFASDRTLLAELVTNERAARLGASDWEHVRDAVGEGGTFRVEVTGASVLPDGAVLRGPVRATSTVRFSGAGEHPTGVILYGQRVRPVGAHMGPVSPHMRDVVARQVDMRGSASYVLADLPGMRALRTALRARHGTLPGLSGPSDATTAPALLNADRERLSADAWGSVDLSHLARRPGVPTWSLLPFDLPDNCLGCHALSADRRLVAVNTADPAALPDDWTATQGSIHVVELATSRVIGVFPGGTTLRFHPTDPDLLLYTATGNSANMLDRLSVFRSDVHVVDLASGRDLPLAGAADPTRCELFPAWSPDGRTVAFSRTRPGEPCEGSTAWFEVATVPYEDGRGGEPGVPEGASVPDQASLQPTYSPDGRWLVVYRTTRGWFSRGSADLWVLPATGGSARKLSVSTDALESQHQFSPDGRWLAFLSNRDRVDRPRGYVARFFEDGTTAAPVPLPGPEAEQAHLDTLDWTR